MAVLCGLCHQAASKYKCPTCAVRYCSLACYKPHKASHEADAVQTPAPDEATPTPPAPTPTPARRPGTHHSSLRKPALSFSNLLSSPSLQRLLTRYPTLKPQLQAIYALTLDPGPDAARTWNREPLPSLERPRGNFRGRGRGRGRGGRGGRGGMADMNEERERGVWTKEKGDKEALLVLKKMREGRNGDERVEGLREFVTLVGLVREGG